MKWYAAYSQWEHKRLAVTEWNLVCRWFNAGRAGHGGANGMWYERRK